MAPMHPEQEAPMAAARETKAPDRSDPANALLSIAMIEDDAEDAMIIEDALRYETDLSPHLRVFSDLDSGLEHLTDAGADVLLLDLRLPDSVGLPTLERVLEEVPQLPVVVLTGLSDPDLAMQAVNAGAQDYLVKGDLDGELLARTIRYSIERHRLKREVEAQAEALQDSEARFRAMVEQNADAIVAIDSEGTIVFANRAAARLFDRYPDGLIGETFGLPLADADGSEVELVQDGDRALTVEMRVSETPWQGEQVRLVSMRDVTERKQAARALQNANRQLAAAMDELKDTQRKVIQPERLRALGEMASGIAHDFNNVLAPILGFSEIMLGEDEDFQASRVQELAGYINTAAQDARSTVSRLREFYRHKEDIETLSRIDVREIVSEAVELTQPKWKDQAQGDGIEIRVERDLEPVEEVLGDPGELREVLINLILNAVDAMPDGGTIRVFAKQDGETVAFGVSDEGTGMDEKTARRCMDPMFSTKGSEGTGMGLAVSYGIIRRHRGEVKIDSEPDCGTTMTCLLPVAEESEDQPPVPAIDEAVEALDLLLVDDDDSVRKVVSALLEGDGHRVDPASEGDEALRMLDESAYDVVITDRAMPEMNGDELARQIKRRYPQVPVLLLTGFGDMMTHAGESPEGVDLIVSKPVSEEELRRALLTLVE
jgi:signal transduction histidine kinase